MSQRILSSAQFKAFMQNTRPVDFTEGDPEVDAGVIRHTSGIDGGHARPGLGELRHAAVRVHHPDRELS